jgi:hypothetical protein
MRTELAKATKVDDSCIVIGQPHGAVEQQKNNADKDHLCVFFYRMGYSGFPVDAGSGDPLYLQAFCMITALGGNAGPDGPSPGDSELKLIGAVAEYFHQKPVLKLKDEKGTLQSQIQIVPIQLSLDDINHLWATQNNTPYRLSLSYELAMLPVPLKARAESGPKVKAIALDTYSELNPSVEEREERRRGRRFFSPQVPIVQVDTARLDWVPHICILDNGEPTYTLDGNAPPAQITLVLLGDPGTDMLLTWEIWNPDAPTGTPRWHTVEGQQSYQPAYTSLLEAMTARSSVQVAVHGTNVKGQALLRATRSFTREGQAPRTLSSNPVLITISGGL